MELKKIEIKNFRSIADIEIVPKPTCQGFVGINESGKTNILKAISSLSTNVKLNKNDIRMESSDEDRNQEAYIKYYFELSSSEMKEVLGSFLDKIYYENTTPIIQLNNKAITIRKLFEDKNSCNYICNLRNATKISEYYTLNENESAINIQGLKIKVDIDIEDEINSKTGKIIELSDYDFFATNCIEEGDLSLFKDCTTDDLNRTFGNLLCSFLESNLPNVIYWEYDIKNLLPDSISLNDFKNNPNSCIPLKSMFNLAGYDDINKVLTDAMSQRSYVLNNILKNVSIKSTEYLYKVWRDYKNVKFQLMSNGNNIDIHIQDSENYYACDQRSDGFKRFITFLLVLSARVSSDEIKDAIIIIDEPDLGIHILGQKNLLQELIKISRDNLVFFSTHSIFMIDKKQTNRHYIVYKKNGITTISQANESNYTDDEVLYNALGYSIFENLNYKNIIFEGWTDKHVYEIVMSNRKAKRIDTFDKIGKIHAKGVKNISCIAKILELANREYIVISDSDKPAQDLRKVYIEEQQCIGEWYTYEQLVPGIITLEDFICHNSFKKGIENARKNHTELVEFDYIHFSERKNNRLDYIKNWIKSSIVNNESVNSILKEIKNELYSTIKVSDIEETYYDLLNELNNKELSK